MKNSEIISKYQDSIKEEMMKRYRYVLESYGMIQYKIYIWEDGEIECLEEVQGSNSYLKAKNMEPRTLVYVCKIDSPCFDPWDYSDHTAPDDLNEKEAEEKEIFDYMVDEYKQNISDVFDSIIEEAEQDEAFA